ncbi:MAG TPA: TIM-barrel domain-containing protein [Anaerolineaceae bacterium]
MNSNPDLFERIRFRGNPVAAPEAIVSEGNARFTVLTTRLIRMEWSETGEFEDRGTYAFPTRFTEVPPFTQSRNEIHLIIKTGDLQLCYKLGSGKFSPENLSINFTLNGQQVTWKPGMTNPGNLRGTRRTVDGCEGDASLDEGLLSRDGWVLFDDSRSVVFETTDGWVSPRPEQDLQDWYFFGYGHNYKTALAEYTRFGGAIPLIPRYILGAWWSRYWAYSEQDLRDLVAEFEANQFPLDVFVIDMDWHTPVTWTGYTWNRDLFPNPPAFLRWLHKKGLRITLNLHPAQGIQAHEEIYPRFANAMGIDPTTKQPVPFQITNKQIVENYFKLIHHPMEDDGVDFWWMDWQQGDSSEMKGLDPLIWINHLHFMDSTRRGKRPMLYSRWGGLGNHRYYIGFSGDSMVVWQALQFQPYLTATASNVNYGWWSHDLGGHMGGATEPELFARWLQFGALSPCMRLHATKDERAERRPWKYSPEVYKAAKNAFEFRYQLIPYIYTMARHAADTSISLCRPMYYEYPEIESAYHARYQYFFGDQMIAAPFVFPANKATGMADADIWVPEGDWIEYTTKEIFHGPRWVHLVGDLNRLPILMKAGAILPLAAGFEHHKGDQISSGNTHTQIKDHLLLSIFPGKEGRFRLYEDDGETEAYKQGNYEWTNFQMVCHTPANCQIDILPSEGNCPALPSSRSYTLLLQGSNKPDRVTINGSEIRHWRYLPMELLTEIPIPKTPRKNQITVNVECAESIWAVGESQNQLVIREDVCRLLGDRCPGMDKNFEDFTNAAFTVNGPGKLDAISRLGGPLVRFIDLVTPEEANKAYGKVIIGAPMNQTERFDLTIRFELHRAGTVKTERVRMVDICEDQVIDVPFRYDGKVESLRWKAEVKINWRGMPLTWLHESCGIFPAIPAWKGLILKDEEAFSITKLTDASGWISKDFEWETYQQDSSKLVNYAQPYIAQIGRAVRERCRSGEQLSAVFASRIISLEEQTIALLYRSAGPATFYLNGNKIDTEPVKLTELVPPFITHPFTPEVRRIDGLHLHKGANSLVVIHKAGEGRWIPWYFGAAIIDETGELLENIKVELK